MKELFHYFFKFFILLSFLYYSLKILYYNSGIAVTESKKEFWANIIDEKQEFILFILLEHLKSFFDSF